MSRIKGVRGEVYFHVLEPDRKLLFLDQRLVEIGRELKASREAHREWFGSRASDEPELCVFGMHACRESRDILWWYGTTCLGFWLCSVRLWGNVIHGDHKSVGMRRKVIAMRQIQKEDMEGLGEILQDSNATYQWILAGSEKGC